MANSLDNANRSALSWAAESGSETVVELLLGPCAKQLGKIRVRSVRGGKSKNYKSRIKSIFKLGSNLHEQQIHINSDDLERATPLMLGAKNGHKRVVELLLEHNAKIDCTYGSNESAIEKAANNGHEDIVMLLFKRSARTKSKSKAFRSALVSAAGSGHGALVKILLDRGVNIESKDQAGKTALAWAAHRGESGVIKLLLEHNADVETRDKEGCTPLMQAVKHSTRDTVAFLLDHNADMEAKDYAGQSVISFAYMMYDSGPTFFWGNFSLLLQYGATMTTNHFLDAAICQEAPRKGDMSAMRYLLDRGGLSIESKSGFSRCRLSQDLTRLSIAVMEGHKGMMKFLLERNANIEAGDNKGSTPLLWAARAFKAAIVDLLLEHHAETEFRDNQGKIPLLIAVREQRPCDTLHANGAVVEARLNPGANAEAKDNDGMTPLQWAVTNNWPGAVKQMLEHNVKTDCRDQDGRTAWQLAEYLGEKPTIIEILKRDADENSQLNWSRTLLPEAAEKGSDSVVKQYLEDGHDIEAETTSLAKRRSRGRQKMGREQPPMFSSITTPRLTPETSAVKRLCGWRSNKGIRAWFKR